MSKLFDLAKNEDLSKLELDFGGHIEVINVNEELLFNETTLDDEDIPEHCARVSVLHSFLEDYQFEIDKKKLFLEKREAEIWNYAKDNLKDESKKVFSDTRVNNIVDSNPELYKIKEEILELTHKYRKLKYIIGLFDSKEKLMQTYSSNLRHTNS